MTQEEFKAWFDGFCEGIDKMPTEKQWKRVKERVKEIDGSRVTERIFVDRYDPYDYLRGRYFPRWNEVTCAVGTQFASGNMGVTAGNVHVAQNAEDANWNSTSAMFALGSAEAKEVA